MTRHTKRIVSPVFWNAGRKIFVWITSANPGPHGKRECFPLLVLVRDVLKLSNTGREAKAIIKEGKILVDGIARRDHKFPVGFMDVVSVPEIKKNYRAVPYEKGLKVVEIPEKEADTKVLRVISKQAVNGGKLQVTAHDGRNFIGTEANVGDSLLLKGGKVSKIMKMEKDSLCLVFKGRQAGRMGRLVSFDRVSKLHGAKESFEVPGKYIMVIGEKTPVVTLYAKSND